MSRDPQPNAMPGGAALPPGWARPTPVRHDRNVRAWMYFFSGVCLVVALWAPIRAGYQRTRYQPLAEGERDAHSFVALAYGGVSAGRMPGPEEVNRAQFEEQIRALRRNGYNPIGLQDVRAFYLKGAPLPRKAVLITMEQGKRNSYLETRDILHTYRWKAVMLVRGDTVARGDPDALRWPILRDMARSGTWEIGAESFDGFAQVPAGPEGETGNFFSTPMWLTGERRLETVAEFTARIRAEHHRAREAFQAGMGRMPDAFAFPYGDYGQYDPRAVATRVLNLDAVRKNYGIGFTLGPFLLNTRHSDPAALNRLLVRPEWSVEQFLSIVDAGQAVDPAQVADSLAAARWLTTWGESEHAPGGGMRLRAARSGGGGPVRVPTTGASSWMVGSDLFQDFTVRMRFRLLAGQLSVRLRARPGGEAGLRLLLDSEGNCRVHQKLYGAPEVVHAAVQDAVSRTGAVRELELTLRGRTLFATLDGRMVPVEPVELMGAAEPGLFGLEVWEPREGTADLAVLSLEFPPSGVSLLNWEADAKGLWPGLMAGLHRDAPGLAGISPPWMDIIRSVPLVLPRWDGEALRLFGAIRKVPVLPRIAVRSAELALGIPPEMPVEEAVRLGANGIYVQCGQVPPDEMPRLMPWLQRISELSKEQNMKLAITFPSALVRMSSFASIATLFPAALVAVDEPGAAQRLTSAVPGVVQAVTPVAADLHLQLYHQLAERALPEDVRSPWARQEAARRDGFLAYQDGNYDEAIRMWSQWLVEDPNSAEALSLIGRAYVQKDDPETALDYYTRSLQTAPGQIHMAIRRAELLDKMGRTDEAREQLNLYARVFPENADILIAQAQWLYRRKRLDEARAMLATLVTEAPENLDARVALLNMQDDPRLRYGTMRGILELGRVPDSQLPFGHLLLAKELLTYPESSVFFEHIRAMAGPDRPPRQRELYERFLPLTRTVTDHFAAGRLSDSWIASGGIRAMEGGHYELRAAIDQTETYLRLRSSELMRDGMLEVSLDESQGFFWIYARRSARAMVRFGFDEDGVIHLQAWNGGELLANINRPWVRPPGSLTLRLELRGDGARGYVNGMEIFDGPLGIPPEVAYGWWGIAPFSFELGVARARILRMDCAPLPSVLALVAPGRADDQVAELRKQVGGLSALAPLWAVQNADGSLPAGVPDDARTLRMFCAFHRIRLLPVVDLAYNGNVDTAQIADFVRTRNLAGAVVKRRTPPEPAWLQDLQRVAETNAVTLIVLQSEAALWNAADVTNAVPGDLVARPMIRDHLLPASGEPLVLREVPAGSSLLSPLRDEWRSGLSLPGQAGEGDDWRVTPRIHLLGPGGWLAPENESASPSRDAAAKPERTEV